MEHLKKLKQIWRISKGYWYSEEKLQARFLFFIIVFFNLSGVGFLVLINQWTGDFYNTLQNYDSAGFFASIRYFIVLGACYVGIMVYEEYLRQLLELKWRKWLTDSFREKWLSKKIYYNLQFHEKNIDNPDQRICEDLRLLAALTLQLFLGIFKATMKILSFGVILWKLSGPLSFTLAGTEINIPGYLVWAALLYSLIGTWAANKIGRPLIGLNYMQQRYEADFRFNMIRVRENSEEIAFYKGEDKENDYLKNSFKYIFDNFKDIMKRKKKLSWFSGGYGQFTFVFPFIVAAPQYFAQKAQLGGLVQTATAFGRVQEAMSYFVSSYTILAEWNAVVSRLIDFYAHMDSERQENSAIQINCVEQSRLQINDLAVGLPAGGKLFSISELAITQGENLLITGKNGQGKTTLLRALAGLWQFGGGVISLPDSGVMFIPQKTYFPQGSLRDILQYPATAAVSEEELQEILTKCQLRDYIPALDKIDKWGSILSLGEQQKFILARILIQKPQWLFLDEATSALDVQSEEDFYRLLQDLLPGTTIVSVGHRKTLEKYHQKHFDYKDMCLDTPG